MVEHRKERIKQMMDVLPPEWDMRPIALAEEIAVFLETIKDVGTGIDSGTDGQSGDLWVTVQSIEYFINIRKSNKQLAKEREIPPLR